MVNGRTVAEGMAARHEERNGEPPQWPRWISVSERLPDQHEIVMVGWAGRLDIGNGYFHDGKCHDPLVRLPDVNQPTHWMPLPPPPAKETD